ncbi:hypothetical protein [uncultured Mediterranean phage uvDeep-CGR2-AD3-C191]|nr:hypothetical protein [uncultured Mediterranean phage uvDeep-CGR2-AD3-C191]
MTEVNNLENNGLEIAGQSCEDRTRVKSMRFRAEALTPDPNTQYANFTKSVQIEVEPLDGISAEEVANIWQPKVDRLVGQAIKVHLQNLPKPSTSPPSGSGAYGAPPSSPQIQESPAGGGLNNGKKQPNDFQLQMVAELTELALRKGLSISAVEAYAQKNLRYKTGKPVSNLHYLSNDNRASLEAWINSAVPSSAPVAGTNDVPF